VAQPTRRLRREDIAYAVGRLASFLDCFQPEYCVQRYLKGTMALSLILQLEGRAHLPLSATPTPTLIAALLAGTVIPLISWSSRKQRLIADSTCYAEYIALHESSHEAIFLRQLLDSIDFPCRGSTPIYCDNNAASRLAEDQGLPLPGQVPRDPRFHRPRRCSGVPGAQCG